MSASTLRGTVGMALDPGPTPAAANSSSPTPRNHLDGRYTVFGQVVTGMDVVDSMQQWDAIRPTIRVWDGVNWMQRRALTRDRAGKKKGTQTASPFLICWRKLSASSPSWPSWPPSSPSSPSVVSPLQVGLCVKVAAPPAVASAAWHSARGSGACALLAPAVVSARCGKVGSVDHRPW